MTDAAVGEFKEIHLRRPLVLAPDAALEWLDPETTTDQAKQILLAARPESTFQWWQVTKAIGNSKYQLADASEPRDVFP